MIPISMPKCSWRTLATGARQFVVQDAFETILCAAGSKSCSLTPMQMVTSASFDGAEMITCSTDFFRCSDAFAREVKRPDDSTTISTPKSFQGISDGSGDEKTRSSLPSMVM